MNRVERLLGHPKYSGMATQGKNGVDAQEAFIVIAIVVLVIEGLNETFLFQLPKKRVGS